MLKEAPVELENIPLEKEQEEEKKSVAYWWCAYQLHDHRAQEELEKMSQNDFANLADLYGEFYQSLSKSDQELLDKMRRGQKGENPELVPLFARQFEKFVASKEKKGTK
jgi:hypothetical protein